LNSELCAVFCMNQMDFCLSSSLTEALKTLSSEPGRGPLHLAQTQQVSLSLWTERSRPPAVASFHLVQAAMCTEGKSVSQAGCAGENPGDMGHCLPCSHQGPDSEESAEVPGFTSRHLSPSTHAWSYPCGAEKSSTSSLQPLACV
jgi:hypothetical protein